MIRFLVIKSSDPDGRVPLTRECERGMPVNSADLSGERAPPALVKGLYCVLTAITAVAVLVWPALSVTRSVIVFEGVPKLYVNDALVLIVVPLDCRR
jgi:hypothetical protein